MKRSHWLIAYLLLAFCFFLLLSEWSRLPGRNLQVTILDVGQGDAILIETPGYQRILIDGGPDFSLLERLGEALPFFSRRIDLLVLSHTDADHITALPEVLARYDVQHVLMTGVERASPLYQNFLRMVIESNARVIIADSSHDIDLGEGAMIDILWPTEDLYGTEVKEQNNASIVMKLSWKDHKVLFTGDIEDKVEEVLLKSDLDLTADILKVPHHGSKTSTSTGFLLAVAPDLAVISVGRENTYGHPHHSVLARLKAFDIPIQRTDQKGNIELSFF